MGIVGALKSIDSKKALKLTSLSSLKELSYDRAKLEFYKDAEHTGEAETINFMFNPENYTVKAEAEWMRGIDSISGANTQVNMTAWIGNKPKEFSTSIFFDTNANSFMSKLAPNIMRELAPIVHEGGELRYDVYKEYVEFLERKLRPASGDHSPNYVRFVWGSFSFSGVLTKVDPKYEMFNKYGAPTRATVSIVIMECEKKNVTILNPLQSPDRTKCKVIKDGDTLWDIARREYSDENEWRLIARANGIEDPLDIARGTIVKVPALK